MSQKPTHPISYSISSTSPHLIQSHITQSHFIQSHNALSHSTSSQPTLPSPKSPHQPISLCLILNNLIPSNHHKSITSITTPSHLALFHLMLSRKISFRTCYVMVHAVIERILRYLAKEMQISSWFHQFQSCVATLNLSNFLLLSCC